MRRTLLIDSAVAALVFGWTLLMIAGGGLGLPDPDRHHLDALGIVLSGATAVPLLARRARPGSAYAVTAIATLALLWLRYPVDVPLGAAVAGYGVSVVYGASPNRVVRRAALASVLAFVPAVMGVLAVSGHAFDITTDILGWTTWLAIFAGIWLVGDRTRLRRQQMWHLQDEVIRAQHDAERERRLAAAEERTRIARELHDSAGHAINVILVQAGAARLLHERDPAGSRTAIATIEQVARTTIGEIDRLVRALREDDAAEALPTGPSALEDLVARHRDTGLRVETTIESPGRPLPDSVAWATYRIVQEALTNAAKHGGGRADLAVRPGPDAVEIRVTNPTRPRADGGRPAAGGHGIIGMRERASLLGGTLETIERSGTFMLHARLPLHGAYQ